MLLARSPGQAGRVAVGFYRQLEAAAADEPLVLQAVRGLVFLALPMYTHDEASGNLPGSGAAQQVRNPMKVPQGGGGGGGV